MRPAGIQYKLIRVFVAQLLLISIVTFLGVYGTAKIVEQVLIKAALQKEAEFFWSLYATNPDMPLPNTRNLTGYFIDTLDPEQTATLEPVPHAILQLSGDYGRVTLGDAEPLVLHSQRYGRDLYLVFNEGQVSQLIFFFGIAPLALVLIVIYLAAWIAYRQTRNAISPMIQLADIVTQYDIKHSVLQKLDLSSIRQHADADVLVLIDALTSFANRLVDFVERERAFTRDASHELRTPLAVIKGNLELLQQSSDKIPQATIIRMQQTVDDMQTLVDTLLLLAREPEVKLPGEPVIINDIVQQQLEQTRQTIGNRDIGVQYQQHQLLEVHASDTILSILFGNLLRNAFNYTQQGQIIVSIQNQRVSIRDSGPGISDADLQKIFEPFYRAPAAAGQQGYGVGLTIVKRLCERCDWQLDIASQPGSGTLIQVYFPQARVVSELTPES